MDVRDIQKNIHCMKSYINGLVNSMRYLISHIPMLDMHLDNVEQSIHQISIQVIVLDICLYDAEDNIRVQKAQVDTIQDTIDRHDDILVVKQYYAFYFLGSKRTEGSFVGQHATKINILVLGEQENIEGNSDVNLEENSRDQVMNSFNNSI